MALFAYFRKHIWGDAQTRVDETAEDFTDVMMGVDVQELADQVGGVRLDDEGVDEAFYGLAGRPTAPDVITTGSIIPFDTPAADTVSLTSYSREVPTSANPVAVPHPSSSSRMLHAATPPPLPPLHTRPTTVALQHTSTSMAAEVQAPAESPTTFEVHISEVFSSTAPSTSTPHDVALRPVPQPPTRRSARNTAPERHDVAEVDTDGTLDGDGGPKGRAKKTGGRRGGGNGRGRGGTSR